MVKLGSASITGGRHVAFVAAAPRPWFLFDVEVTTSLRPGAQGWIMFVRTKEHRLLYDYPIANASESLPNWTQIYSANFSIF